MESQNYVNHRKFVKGYHYALSALLLIGLITAVVNVFLNWGNGNQLSLLLILILFICGFLLAAFTRSFPLKAQDRAIRAEENLRHFVLTGKLLDGSLKVGQITALRFAPDEEFIPLVAKAIGENLSPNDIKKEIKNWRADHHRV
ncbi:DUF6526 family protein [Spirosoma pollinicola]|uniref:Uncharacterized protein n=1 Tax=Spirosoma pollinicola TaxID=2057025 RepID=A0A2K8Z3V4_9BACT|nr:DUF6526 family protein [Spirosoma pollinicola]AUD04567.1 hypothetical protein CWM47_23595 [Spirosoma pollinicola]